MRLPLIAGALGLAFTATVLAGPLDLPLSFDRYAPIQEGITWNPCSPATNKFQCGRFEVPMDYKDASAGKASLMVIRYSVAKEKKLGTLFTNPGGPGASGVETLMSGVSALLLSSGGRYDIVSWDPRGVGWTFPRADCFPSWKEDNKFWNDTIPRAGIEARAGYMSDEEKKIYYRQVPEVDKLLEQLGERCLRQSPNVLQYVGTMATVRDMVRLHDYLEGPDKPLNFWGLSYGTVIGIYFANSFPKRVGRLILDGVVHPQFWAEEAPHKFWSFSIQGAHIGLHGFVEECARAGPTRCAFAKEGATAESLLKRIVGLINRAYDYKKAKPSARLSSAVLRAKLFETMYTPRSWQAFARTLAKWEGDDLPPANPEASTITHLPRLPHVEWLNVETDKVKFGAQAQPVNYAMQAVTCADAIDRGSVTTGEVFREILETTEDVDYIFGPKWGDAGFYCHHWPVRAVERYTGPWNKKPESKILVIGNDGDPITPLSSAEFVADNYGDSAVLIEQENYGASPNFPPVYHCADICIAA